MRKIGCLLFLLVVGLLAVALWFALLVAEWVSPGNPEYLGSILGVVILSIIGFQVARSRSRRLPQAMMAGTPGPAFVGLLGAMLIALPGYLSGLVGLLLQLPALQRAFGTVATTLLMRNLQKMMGGGMGGLGGMPPGGFPGGFPGGTPPGGFPGGFPGKFPGAPPPGAFPGMQPDSRSRRGKVIDTTAERIDEDKP
jgi:UPF0716 family protein affecting phage T7 exclusion